ncbi:MAG TPA: inorganic diphosphatase [Candidatus Sulfotelmatobacter sp.]|nr:inorganic diphosphatase [Candidatus Sulfotelmatobacter sp.]
MPKKNKGTPATLTSLNSFADRDTSLVRVVIETPKGCRNKYKFEPEMAAFKLSNVLPEGMVFPYDFGFIPDTQAEDGDPIDVLLLMDQPAFPGCVIESRLVGVIEAQQSKDGKTERNDRLIAVAEKNHSYSDLRNINDMNKTLLQDIGQFFTNYHEARGSKFKVLGIRGPKEAYRLLKKALKPGKAA